MKHHKISLIIIFTVIFQTNLLACSCCYNTTTFCGIVEGDSTENLALVKIKFVSWTMNYEEIAFVDVIDYRSNHVIPDSIVIIEDLCTPSLFAWQNDTLLLKLYPYGMFHEYTAYSQFGGCGVSSLRYQNDTLIGGILPNIGRMAYSDFLENLPSCADSPQYFRISGKISSWANADVGIENLAMSINGFNAEPTDSNGRYSFDYVRFESFWEHQAIIPESNEDLLRGLTMADALKIKQHILNIERLDNPYQLIAADVNNSASVTTLDLIHLSKAILGLEESFPNNDSWRFIENGYSFSDPENPWIDDFDADITLELCEGNGFSGIHDYVDITAIKIGDVNGSI